MAGGCKICSPSPCDIGSHPPPSSHPSPATPPLRPASGGSGHPRHPSHHNLPLSLSDRGMRRAGENHPWWLHTLSGPSQHLRNQDRTFASTSWSTRHLSSQSPARDPRPPPDRPSSRTQLGWEVGLVTLPSCWMQCLVAFPSASCRAVQVCFVLLVDAVALFCFAQPGRASKTCPARVRANGGTSMAEQ